MGLEFPRLTVEEPTVDDSRMIAIRSLREAAEYVALGDTARARTLAESALIWLDGMP